MMKSKNMKQQQKGIYSLIFLLLITTFYPNTNFAAQRISSTCTLNNSLDVKMIGIRNAGSKNIPDLSNKVKKVVVECTCRGRLRLTTEETCPNTITFTVNGQNKTVTRIIADKYSSWWGNDVGLYEGDMFIYRYVHNGPVTSLTYKAPSAESNKKGMRGLTAWIVNNDAAKANQPSSIFIDEFHYQWPKKINDPIRCFNIPVKPTNSSRDMTIHIPLSEIEDKSIINTRHSAKALNANGTVVATLPPKLLNRSNIAPEIRSDNLSFKNVPGSATTIRVCLESPNPKIGDKHGPSYMVGSIAVTSIQNKPSITCPTGGTVACAKDIKPGKAIYKPECPDDDKSATVTGPIINGEPDCPGTTYTFTHSAGSISCKQVFIIGNNAAPVFTCNPNIIEVCEEDDIITYFPEYTVSCGVNATENISDPVIVGEPGCAGTTYTFTYTVTDVCGRSTFCEQTFKIKEECVAMLGTYENGNYILKKGYVTIYDGSNCQNYKNIKNCNPVSGCKNLTANEVFLYATKTFEYFFNNHIISKTPHLNIIFNYDDDEYLNQAIYKPNQNTIVLGKGDGVERHSMIALDILAHEITHHIVKSIGTPSHYGENGALHESFADIFGEMVENDCYGENDWIFGSEVFLPDAEYNGIRVFPDPSNSNIENPQPKWYNGQYWDCDEDVDNGCIHIRSGVQNLWYYLLVNGNSSFDGIGKVNASKIVFSNMISLLSTNTYTDAMSNSISIANKLFPNDDKVNNAINEAWKAVGLDPKKWDRIVNPIELNITNYRINGDSFSQVVNRITTKPRYIDITLDSLGLDMSGDNFTFTMLIPENYRDFEVETVYPPLNEDMVCTTYNQNSVTIEIDREKIITDEFEDTFQPILSGAPLFRIGVCIDVIDVGGEENSKKEEIEIFGFTELNSGQKVPIAYQVIAIEEKIDTLTVNRIQKSLQYNTLAIISKLTHQNCLALGAIELELVDVLEPTKPPYNYYLYDEDDKLIQSILSKATSKHQFYNLKEGAYMLKAEDSSNRPIQYNFDVAFIGDLKGGICCPDYLTIPKGEIDKHRFFAKDSILIDQNTEITEGLFKICNDW